MIIGELKEMIKDIPDDSEVICCNPYDCYALDVNAKCGMYKRDDVGLDALDMDSFNAYLKREPFRADHILKNYKQTIILSVDI